MNPEARLAQVATALDSVGLTVLVMGGHARNLLPSFFAGIFGLFPGFATLNSSQFG